MVLNWQTNAIDLESMDVDNLHLIILEYLLSFLIYLLMVVVVLVGVAFITLFERKILGYVHLRKGPNVVGYWGLFQPMADAVKLFIKEQVRLMYSNYLVYYLSPSLNILLALVCWVVFNFIFYVLYCSWCL
jgi:NADH-ubiquinone oxidoreductase chain 1